MYKFFLSACVMLLTSLNPLQARDWLLGPIGEVFFAKEFLANSPFCEDEKANKAFIAGTLYAYVLERTDSSLESEPEATNSSAFFVGKGFHRYIKRQFRNFANESKLGTFMKEATQQPFTSLFNLSELYFLNEADWISCRNAIEGLLADKYLLEVTRPLLDTERKALKEIQRKLNQQEEPGLYDEMAIKAFGEDTYVEKDREFRAHLEVFIQKMEGIFQGSNKSNA